jgi:hypothetical protein
VPSGFILGQCQSPEATAWPVESAEYVGSLNYRFYIDSRPFCLY